MKKLDLSNEVELELAERQLNPLLCVYVYNKAFECNEQNGRCEPCQQRNRINKLQHALIWALKYVRLPNEEDAEFWAEQYNSANSLVKHLKD